MDSWCSRWLGWLLVFSVAIPDQAAFALDGSTLSQDRGKTTQTAAGGAPVADPFTGAATYTIPILVPPGTGGMTPDLALTYSSQGPVDSWVGSRWSLGLPSIERSLARGVPSYADSDVFQFAGQDLIPDGSTPGLYHTERESFLRIVRETGGSWTVTRKDGTVLRFGLDAASRVAGNPPSGAVYQWLLAEQEDVHGNVIQVTYQNAGDPGAQYPHLITYTLRRSGSSLVHLAVDRVVEFELESGPRPDTSINYAAGFLRKVSRRLRRIRVLVGSQLVRSYELSYIQNAAHRRSLLSSVGVLGSDGDLQPPLTTSFSYDSAGTQTGWSSTNDTWTFPNPSSSFAFVDSDSMKRDAGWRLADVNGDALPDLIKYVADWDQASEALTFDSDNGVYLNTGTGWSTTPSASWPLPQAANPLQNPFFAVRIDPASGPDTVQATGRVVADVTGDGRADFLAWTNYVVPADGDAISGLNAGSVFEGLYRGPWWKSATTSSPSSRWASAISAIESDSTFQDEVWFATHGLGLTPASTTIGGNVRFAERNGDGLVDIAVGGFRLTQEYVTGSLDPCYVEGGAYWIRNLGEFDFSVVAPSVFPSGLPVVPQWPGFDETDGSQHRFHNYAPFICGAGNEGGEIDPFSFALSSRDDVIARLEVLSDGLREMVDLNGDGLDDQATAYDQYASHVVYIYHFPFPDPVGTEEYDDDDLRRGARLNVGGRLSLTNSPAFAPPIAFVEIQGEQTEPQTMSPYSSDNGTRFADVDGDGRVDLVRRKGGTSQTWLNDGDDDGGSAWMASTGWVPPFSFVDNNGRDLGVRLADVDGDGMTDIVEATPNNRRVRLNRAELPDLLSKITRPDGGTTNITYLPSTAFAHVGGDDLPDLPMVIPVVHQVEVDDANDGNGTQPAVTTYSYADGRFDSASRKFRGFGTVTMMRHDGRVTTTQYHQSASRAGLPKDTVIQFPSAQGLQDWHYQAFSYTADSQAPYIILPSAVRTEERDGNGANRSSVSTFEYDQYGNRTAVYDMGEVVGLSDVDPNDTRVRETLYAPPNTSSYIVDRPAIQRLRHGTLNGLVLSERHYFYDCNPSSCPGNPLSQAPPTRGLVTKQVDVLADPVRPDPTTTYAYDQYGNVTATTDPRANAFEGGGTTAIQYDAVFHTFPTIVTNPQLHQRTYSYSPSGGCNGVAGAVPHSAGEGLVYEERGPNDLANGTSHWLRCYDRFGRLVLERAPGTLTQTTRSYVDTLPASMTEQVAATNTSAVGSRTTTTHLDGLGRPIRVVSDGAQGRIVSVETSYDDVGRVKSVTAPFFGSPLTKPTTSYLYDPLDRVIESKLPGLNGTRRETTSYAQGWVTHVDANGRTTERLFDPFGNIRTVVEHNGGSEYTTAFEYDVRNLLTRVVDHGANETLIGYDRLGRRTSLDDPDSGLTLFEFDSNGNLVRRQTASGTFFVWFYDSLDRPVARHLQGSTSPEVTWHYDAVSNGIGLLSRRDDLAGRYEAQAFDLLGRPTQERYIRSLGSTSKSFTFATSYTLDGNVSTRTYPNGRILQWTRDAKGFVTEIRSDADIYAAAVDWEEQGRVKTWAAGNGITTTYTFDTATTRLDRIQVGSFENLQYGYDVGDRITSITNQLDGTKNRTFEYDDLDRLDQATGPFGANQAPTTVFYAYDPIGNLTCKGATSLSGCAGGIAMTYPAPGPSAVRPHAPLTVNGAALGYTADGGVSEEGTREFEYSSIGKMSRVYEAGTLAASFTYDGEDQLALINDYSTGSQQKRWIFTSDFEWNQTTQQAKIHVSLGELKIATENDPYAPSSGGGSCSGVAPSVPLDLDRLFGNFLLVLTLLGLSVVLRSRPRHAWGRAVVAVISGVVLFTVTSFPTPVGVGTVDPAHAALQQVEFYHSDAIGSSVLVTNEAGAVVQRTVYEPYGKAIPATGGPANPPEFGFTNQRFIKRAEIYDYGARMYDPKTGRFLQPDSIVPDPTDPQSLNRYSYVRNGPTNRIDPTGNEDQWWYGGSTSYFGYYLDWLSLTFGYDYSQIGPSDPLGSWTTLDDDAWRFGLEAANGASSVDLLSLHGVYRSGSNAASITHAASYWMGAPRAYAAPFERALIGEAFSLAGHAASGMFTAAGGALGATAKAAGGAFLLGRIARLGDDAAALGARGGVGPVRLGQIGEELAGIRPPKTRISIGGRTRIPDELTATTLREVKNVESLSYTRQLRDFTQFSQETGRTFTLEVRQGTRLSGPLQDAVDKGFIDLHRTLP